MSTRAWKAPGSRGRPNTLMAAPAARRAGASSRASPRSPPPRSRRSRPGRAGPSVVEDGEVVRVDPADDDEYDQGHGGDDARREYVTGLVGAQLLLDAKLRAGRVS